MGSAEIALMIGLFLVGVVLVIWCVEVFIEAVSRSAVSLGVSGFLLAVVLAGIDLENAVLGVTAASADLPDLALGTVFGESLFVLAVAVGLAGVFVPFEVDVPRAYLLLLALVALPAFVLSLDGSIGFHQGVGLVTAFVPVLSFLLWYERRSETTYVRSEEVTDAVTLGPDSTKAEVPANDGERPPQSGRDGASAGRGAERGLDLDLDQFVPRFEHRSGLFNLGVAVLATVGLTVGSLITVFSAERVFLAFGISELAFGATVLSFVASLEELALTVEPARRGAPNIAVGNVVGSTAFYMTANVGLIALLRPVGTAGAVMTVQWPFFVACLLVVSVMLLRGRVTRSGGTLLLGLYVGYWVVNYL